jgi:hypothetical protein
MVEKWRASLNIFKCGEYTGAISFMNAGENRKKSKGDRAITDWKHSQINEPEDVDGLSELLSMEIDRDVQILERRLEAYWKKRRYY